MNVYQVDGNGYLSRPEWDLLFVLGNYKEATININNIIHNWGICGYTIRIYRG